MKAIRWLFLLAILSALVLCTGCSCGDDDDDDSSSGDDDDDDDDNDDNDDDDNDDDTTPVLFPFDIDFEDYPLGDLQLPWTEATQGGVSYTEIISFDKADTGQALHIFGGTTTSDYAWAEYLFTPVGDSVTIEMDIKRDTNAGFGFYLYQNPGFQHFIEIEVGCPPSGELYGYDYADKSNVVCATVPEGDWFRLKVIADYSTGLFDVLIDDAATPCANLAMQYGNQSSFGGFGLFDPDNDGIGGKVWFDNMLGYTP